MLSSLNALNEQSKVRYKQMNTNKKQVGFAVMDKAVLKDIASRGGKAAHARVDGMRVGNGHEFSSEEARIAGRKGGLSLHAKRREQKEENANELATSNLSLAGMNDNHFLGR